MGLALLQVSFGIGQFVADEFLLGESADRLLAGLPTAYRLEPILKRQLRDAYVYKDPRFKDEYMGRLVGVIVRDRE
jgi:hypothetical protein